MIQVCDLSFANSSITDTLGNYSLVSSGTVTISGHTYPANTDPILYGTDSSYNYVEFGQTATYSNGAIIQAGIPDYGSENWAVEFRARVTSAIPVNTGSYAIFFGCSAPYDDNGTIRTGGYWAISVDSFPAATNELRFFYDYNNEDLTLKDNLDLTSWHLYRVTKNAEDILTLHIDGVLVATIDIEQQTGFKSRATLGSFALLGAVEELPTANHIQTNQLVRLADVKVYADPMGHAEKAVSLDNLSRVFRNYNTWLGAQLSGQIGDGTLTIKVNGATAGTFTANQSTAATANITVPTKTSDLTNDSGFITSDNTKIPLAGSNAISGSLIPSTDNSIDIGSSTKNIKTLYTKGITINGTQFLPSDYLPKTTTLESLSTNSIPFHNAYPRCKYLGTTITDAQNTAIKNRTYDDLFIGDYWTINGVNWRIVAIDYYYNVGDTNFDKGNIIVMPDTVLYNAQMNETDTTAGAYAGSLMRTQNLNSARTIAQNAFGSHLANHRIMLANSVNASGPNGFDWYDSDGVELPNEVQIYGARIWGSALKGFDVGTQKQQFPLFALAPQFVNTRQGYWLQDVSSASVSSSFVGVYNRGGAGYHVASNSLGVRPSFTLSYI